MCLTLTAADEFRGSAESPFLNFGISSCGTSSSYGPRPFGTFSGSRPHWVQSSIRGHLRVPVSYLPDDAFMESQQKVSLRMHGDAITLLGLTGLLVEHDRGSKSSARVHLYKIDCQPGASAHVLFQPCLVELGLTICWFSFSKHFTCNDHLSEVADHLCRTCQEYRWFLVLFS